MAGTDFSKRVIFQSDDGGVSVVVPNPAARADILVSEEVIETVLIPEDGDVPEHEVRIVVEPAVYRPETDEEFILRIANKDVPTGKPYKIVDVSDIPSDRSMRMAWTVDVAVLTDGVGE